MNMDFMSMYGVDAALIASMMVIIVVSWIVFYVYSSLTLMLTANKLKMEKSWLAWIPIANLFLMAKMAKMHWGPILLLIVAVIPFIGSLAAIAFAVFVYVWWWKICEVRKMPGWYVLPTLIPVLGGIWALILWGMLAWRK